MLESLKFWKREKEKEKVKEYLYKTLKPMEELRLYQLGYDNGEKTYGA